MSIEQAKKLNQEGYGIHWAINDFRERRCDENVYRVRYWVVDIDSGNKEEILFRIRRGLYPTNIVETKNGYHLYFMSIDGTLENWVEIVSERLVPFYKADKNGIFISRTLRAPNYNHMKDPSNPFLLKQIYSQPSAYKENQILSFYKEDKTTGVKKEFFKRDFKQFLNSVGENFFENVWNLDCEYALSCISGKTFVGGEEFSFRNNKKGTTQIFVNRRPTSCWIDQTGRIGSYSNGGPTILQWLKWYGTSSETCIEILKQEFPELCLMKK